MTDREALILAFKDLRKAGFLTSFGKDCCNSCCGYRLLSGKRGQKMKAEGKIRCVYFSRQTEFFAIRAFGDKAWIDPKRGIYLNWQDDVTKNGSAALIRSIIEKQGLTTEWDGNLRTSILVYGQKDSQ